MKLGINEGKTIQFYKTKMVFKASTEQTDGAYTTILMTHPAWVGPALHLHPDGAETFFILKGNYTFTLGDDIMEASVGDFILIPKNQAHKYISGAEGGQMLVTTPSGVEQYFLHIAARLLEGEIPLAEEFEFAKRHGQIFLDSSGHWGHK